MATGPKAGFYQNAQSASYLPPTLDRPYFALFIEPNMNYVPNETTDKLKILGF